MQVLDSEGSGLTGKGAGAAAPVRSWGCPQLACVNERDRERAWSRDRDRVWSDVARAGWGAWAALVHGRGSGFAWGIREGQRGCCTRLLGQRDREEVGSSRWAASGAARARAKRGARVHPWGCQVGSQGRWRGCTRLVSGQRKSEGWGRSWARPCNGWLGSLLSLSLISLIQTMPWLGPFLLWY
jgi:hypothetical protein